MKVSDTYDFSIRSIIPTAQYLECYFSPYYFNKINKIIP